MEKERILWYNQYVHHGEVCLFWWNAPKTDDAAGNLKKLERPAV